MAVNDYPKALNCYLICDKIKPNDTESDVHKKIKHC
jgi:hypothetical protein